MASRLEKAVDSAIHRLMVIAKRPETEDGADLGYLEAAHELDAALNEWTASAGRIQDDQFTGREMVLFTRTDGTPCAIRLEEIAFVEDAPRSIHRAQPPPGEGTAAIGLKGDQTILVYGEPLEIAMRLAQGELVDMQEAQEEREAREAERNAPITSAEEIETLAADHQVDLRYDLENRKVQILVDGQPRRIDEGTRNAILQKAQDYLETAKEPAE